MNNPTAQNSFKKLVVAGLMLATITTSITLPAIAQYYRKSYGLFRPYAYWDFPYRRSTGNGSDEIIKALNDKGLTVFAQELKKTDFYNSLDQKGIVTIFAPSNNAFNLQDYDARRKVQQNIASVLKYHIVPGEISENTLDQDKAQINTLEGSPLTITVLHDGKIHINDASVTANTSTLVYNGEVVNRQIKDGQIKAVIIKIDKLLLPPDV